LFPEIAERFGGAEDENAALAQREMEHRQNLRLHFRTQIDQNIAARHEIEPRERRIGQQILSGENHRLAQFTRYPITAMLLDEEAVKARRRHVLLDRVRVQPVARRWFSP